MTFWNKKKLTIGRFARIFSVVLGLVLIWRGIWYALDGLDLMIFGGSHTWTAFGGIILGFFILWLPDHDLKEIEKL
ncbi:MAG: hypothetical protein COU47_01030 [Candidatus Niyogibacteria bacterium CG10_big_fil_rev_8_21_14_0_10_46_36]|uniref:Uncharacterized protein n=1 Tax=Candidatus Niyogibacteria bacterium CG10_big_fil_rev_8_21_14_0_10_46_36 TaxID=1974726 RepID=A0A2H0TEN0_9BACT|nr:MAG: hypothetical protein COU47_01030 [Candidatus Niyogibacteria bacterium CG10_big_fil_rev_8_21_14_0_10_46_36]